MADFQLLKGNKPVGDRFDSDVDPYDKKACAALLRNLAASLGKPPADFTLNAYDRGRKVRTYRAT
jgi:hypothetical protein